MVKLEERLFRLEKKCKHLQIILSLLLIFIAFILLMGSKETQIKIITAEQFIRTDPTGKPSLIIGDGFNNTLTFLDKSGKKQMELGVTGTVFPHLSVYDKYGKLRIAFGLAPDSEFPFINFRDKDEKTQVSLSLLHGYPLLQFYDDKNIPRLDIGMMSKSAPSLIMNNEKEKPLVMIGDFISGGQFQLFDRVGRLTYSVPQR